MPVFCETENMTCKALVFFPVCSEFIALQISLYAPEEKLHLCTLSDYWIFSTLPHQDAEFQFTVYS
jgi:hypothetical protein